MITSEISCPSCGGNLTLDMKKSRVEKYSIYSFDCGVYGYFKVMGIELGRKTKAKLERAKDLKEIPF